MANHTQEQYADLIPFVLDAFVCLKLVNDEKKLFNGLRAWIFLWSQIEELTEKEQHYQIELFWKEYSKYSKGITEQYILDVLVPAVFSNYASTQSIMDIRLAGNIIDMSINLWERSQRTVRQ